VLLSGVCLAAGILIFLLLQPPFRVLELKLWLPDGRLVEVPRFSPEFREIAGALNGITPFTRDMFTPAMGAGVPLSEFFPAWVQNPDAVIVEARIWQFRGTQWGNYHTTRLCVGSTTARLPESDLLIAVNINTFWMPFPVERDPVQAAAPRLGRAVWHALDRFPPSVQPLCVGPANVEVEAVRPAAGGADLFPPNARLLLGTIVMESTHLGGRTWEHRPDFENRPMVHVSLREPLYDQSARAITQIRSAFLTTSGGKFSRCWAYLELPDGSVREVLEPDHGLRAGRVLDEYFARLEWPFFVALFSNGRVTRNFGGHRERFVAPDEVGRLWQHALLVLPTYLRAMNVGTGRWDEPTTGDWIRLGDGEQRNNIQRPVPGIGVFPEQIDFYYLPPSAEDPREHYRFWIAEQLRDIDRRAMVTVRQWAGECLALPGVSPAPEPLERLRGALLSMKDATPLPANAPD